jgi:hypothetical protein
MFKAVNPGARGIAGLSSVIFAAASIWVVAGSPAVAQTAASAKPAANLAGFWELHFDSRNIPPASLVSGVAAEDPRVQFEHDMKEVRWCHFFGLPYLMEQSPLDILQNVNGKEVIISTALRTPARHIYTDGRGHVNPDTFDPVSNGHSIGHWEGATLVVDTIGFSGEGITRIPGGGRRTPDSHLIERFRLLDGGNRLSVVSTWEDSKIFARPQTYEVRYFRAPKGTEAREFDCNAADEARAKFLLEPPGSQLK